MPVRPRAMLTIFPWRDSIFPITRPSMRKLSFATIRPCTSVAGPTIVSKDSIVGCKNLIDCDFLKTIVHFPLTIMRLAVALDIPVGGLFYRFLGYLEVKLNKDH
jgi:hypothetical protein